jgi:Anti-sigma factor NepR
MKPAAFRLVPSETAPSVETQIARFLSGETDGHDVLQLLYGEVADEPVPERFRTLIQNGCRLRAVEP